MIRKIRLIFLLLPSLTYAQQALTLEEAIRTALENNYAIKIANSRVRLAENDNTLGNAGFLPIVTGNAQLNFNSSNTNQVFFQTAAAPRDPLILTAVPSNSSTVGVDMAWTIFDGFGMFVARDRLGELVKAGQANAQVTIETTVADVSNAYFDVVRQRQRVDALRDALDSISAERVRLARDRFEVGQGSKLEYLSAQVDYNTDRAALIAQEQALQNAKIALNALLVRDLKTEFAVPDTIALRKDLALESLREQVRRQNPALILAGYNRRVADFDVKAQQSLQYPSVDVLSGYNLSTNNNLASAGFGLQRGRSGVVNFGIRATVPIFDGFNARRRVSGARINQLINEQQESDLKVQLDAALDQTFTNYRNSLLLIELEAQNLSFARQNVDIAFERFRIGVSTSLELREAQRNAVAAETRLIEAQFNTKIAEIELMRLSSAIIE
ncbi:MAG: TolC family protein [Cytophagaceae bacterium]|nr:TolC family protein [Cytophagaceae bacterium]